MHRVLGRVTRVAMIYQRIKLVIQTSSPVATGLIKLTVANE